MEMIKVFTDNNQIYKIESQTKSIVIPTTQPSNIELVSSPSKVEIISIPPSSPGPKGDPFLFEDFTPSQLAQITPTVSVGQTTTLPPGSEASVTDSGTDKNHVLDFGIPRGLDGQRGQAATIQVAGTVTVSPDTPASVINEGSETDARFRFHIPQGQTGEQGIQGIQGIQGEPGPQGQRGPQGKNGIDGVSPSVRVGTVTTGQPGSQASVVNSGTTSNVILDFTIPCGADGQPGLAGQVQDVQVSYDQGQTWQSAMVGSTAKIITGTGGGSGGEMNVIELIQKNGTTLPIVNKTVNVTVPTAVSQLTQDVGYALSSSLSTVAFSGSYNDLSNKPTLVTPGVTGGFGVISAQQADSAINADHAASATGADYASFVELSGVQNADDLKAIEALSGTAGLLRKTGANTWTLDVTAYAPVSSIPQPAVNPIVDDGYLTPNNLSATIQMYWAGGQWWELTSNAELYNMVDGGGTEQPTPIYGIPTRQAIDVDRLDTYTYYLSQKIASTYAPISSLATVATSGDYDDLSNKPTIPNVPIESISVNGTAQTITNKNVDITVPTQGQIASGNTGYVTGGDVYNWVPQGMGYMGHLTTTTTNSTIPVGYSINTLIFIKYRHTQSGSYETYRLFVTEGSWWVMKNGVYLGTADSSHTVEVGTSSGSGTQEFIVQAIRVE